MYKVLLKILIFLVVFEQTIAFASDYFYEKRIIRGQTIHVITLNPEQYDLQIVKADTIKKREPLSVIAKRFDANIAINGGFFEIGGHQDGEPSGTLIIKGHAYRLRNFVQSLIIINSKGLMITRSNPKKYMTSQISILSGIPLLLKKGDVVKNLFEKKSDFFLRPHARTALGIRKDGSIIIVVIEHHYIKDINKLTVKEIRFLMKEKGCELSKKYHHKSPDDITLRELKEILKDEYTSSQGAKGLSILKLAYLMKELGCCDAINLDGGSFSSLWLEDKIVSKATESEEGKEEVIEERSIPNAIIFKRKK